MQVYNVQGYAGVSCDANSHWGQTSHWGTCLVEVCQHLECQQAAPTLIPCLTLVQGTPAGPSSAPEWIIVLRAQQMVPLTLGLDAHPHPIVYLVEGSTHRIDPRSAPLNPMTDQYTSTSATESSKQLVKIWLDGENELRSSYCPSLRAIKIYLIIKSYLRCV